MFMSLAQVSALYDPVVGFLTIHVSCPDLFFFLLYSQLFFTRPPTSPFIFNYLACTSYADCLIKVGSPLRKASVFATLFGANAAEASVRTNKPGGLLQRSSVVATQMRAAQQRWSSICERHIF
jgi:hypothetical protein